MLVLTSRDPLNPRKPAEHFAALDLTFLTVDLALRQDGEWRVIELGDGQVSDRTTSADPHSFIVAMLAA